MQLYFTRLKFGHPEPLKALEDFPESWKVYHICIGPHVGSSTTYRDVSELGDEDEVHAKKAYLTLLGKAQTGFPIKDQYDEKKCHDVHTFDLNKDLHKKQELHTIYRIRAGNIRVYFCYLPPNKTIVILKTRPKLKNELCQSEKNELEDIARSVLQYSNPAIFESRVI